MLVPHPDVPRPTGASRAAWTTEPAKDPRRDDPDLAGLEGWALGVALLTAAGALVGLRIMGRRPALRTAPGHDRGADGDSPGPRLRLDDGPLSGTRFGIGTHGLRIGRDPALCEVVLTEATVSREHALIRIREGAVTLTHLSGTNPTWVNDRPVREARLSHGDAVRIGGVRFTVEVPGGG